MRIDIDKKGISPMGFVLVNLFEFLDNILALKVGAFLSRLKLKGELII